MEHIDYMKAMKLFMQRNRFVTRLYPTLLGEEHNQIICKKLMEDGIVLNSAILEKDIVGISEAIGNSLFTLFGMCQTMGIPIEGVFDEVWRSKAYKKKANVAAALEPAMRAKATAMKESNDRTD